MAGNLIAGVFDSGESLLSAVRAARAEGLAIHDTYAPFAVHGLDEAMGLSRSRLSTACLAFGTTGFLIAFGFQEWAFLYSWPMNIGGKPDNAWPAYIPISFELMVLLAGLGTVATFLFICGLRPGKEPAFPGLGATNDRFVLALECRDSDAGDAETLRRFLESRGAEKIVEGAAG